LIDEVELGLFEMLVSKGGRTGSLHPPHESISLDKPLIRMGEVQIDILVSAEDDADRM
jgi:hypothetical protein